MTGEPLLLFVEGDNDGHAVSHLLVQHGFKYVLPEQDGRRPRFPRIQAADSATVIEVRWAGDVKQVLAAISTVVKVSVNRAVGFVIDADQSLENRWKEVSLEAAKVGLTLPDTPPPTGFVGMSPTFQARVGVWLMPDNRSGGKVEDFLLPLIPDGQRPLLDFASEKTDEARQSHGAEFEEKDRSKAVIQTWLAWQREPGHPYGRAVDKRYFRHDAPAADAFVSWIRQVFSPPT